MLKRRKEKIKQLEKQIETHIAIAQEYKKRIFRCKNRAKKERENNKFDIRSIVARTLFILYATI